MGSNYRVTYGVDMVFCIDATGSMQPLLDTVKDNALNLYEDFQRIMRDEHRKYVEQLRVRVIAFRDYRADKDDAMLVTDFFVLPRQEDDLKQCLESITAFGGGDDPEDGLEALAYAMKSDWVKKFKKNRHVIAVWTDEGTHEIGYGKAYYDGYPNGMPKNFEELTRWWGSSNEAGIMDEYAKRLLIFAPGKAHWDAIRDNWNNVLHYESEAGTGLEDWGYEEILNTICGSI
jgi:hypothetical protein